MKTTSILLLALLAIAIVGCDNDDDIVGVVDKVPTTPQGVYSVTGDDTVTVHWFGIYETDVNYYRVYRSLDSINGYAVIADVDAALNPELHLLIYTYVDHTADNGTKYWYAVTAVDNAGQESDLSAEEVYDTPRPAGAATIYPADADSSHCSFSLTLGTVVDWGLASADFYADRVGDVCYLNGANEWTDIQDLGYTNGFDDVGWAPDTGWSALYYCEAIPGHTYIIWTADNHFAKVRISTITVTGAITFDWAWQSVQGELELAPPVRPPHSEGYEQQMRTKASGLIK